MNQETPPDDVPVVFSFRAWNSRWESWDDYLSAVERAYAQYVERRGSGSDADPPVPHPDPEEGIH